MSDSLPNLNKILQTNTGKRNQDWEQSFLNSFVTSELYLIEENVKIGPDGWPYLYITTDKDQKFEAKDQAQKIIDWAFESGVGIVVNPQKEKPDYIFNYGMIWSFIHRGEFINYSQAVVEENAPIYIAKITDDIIPHKVMHFLKDYIATAGIKDPRFALITRDKINFELALSIESLGSPPPSEHEGIAKAFSWFLPINMPIVLIYEDKLQRLYEV